MRPIASLVLLTACTRNPATDASGHSGTNPTDSVHEPVRVLTWNVELGLGASGSDSYEAVASVLHRIDADVVALNEIDANEEQDVADLASELGLDFTLLPTSNPFGEQRNAILTRLPVVDSHVWTSDELSGDDRANDVTRYPVSVTVQIDGGTLALVSEHWQSGFYDSDTFRRIVDGLRVGQAADRATADVLVVGGDMNAEITDGVGTPASWTSVPSDVPGSFWLGADLFDEMTGGGLTNDPFLAMSERSLTAADAKQMDGRYTTRDSSGRRLDYLFTNSRAVLVGAEVYDSRDDTGDVGLPKSGEVPPRDASYRASDHFPVYLDVGL